MTRPPRRATMRQVRKLVAIALVLAAAQVPTSADAARADCTPLPPALLDYFVKVDTRAQLRFGFECTFTATGHAGDVALVDGNQLVFSDDRACPSPAAYAYSLVGSVLTLTPADGAPCTDLRGSYVPEIQGLVTLTLAPGRFMLSGAASTSGSVVVTRAGGHRTLRCARPSARSRWRRP
jgi:hypothetical protein